MWLASLHIWRGEREDAMARWREAKEIDPAYPELLQPQRNERRNLGQSRPSSRDRRRTPTPDLSSSPDAGPSLPNHRAKRG